MNNALLSDIKKIIEYIRGGDPKKLKKHFTRYDNHKKLLIYNYKKVKINSSPQVTNSLQILLQELNVPSTQWNNYFNLTLYNFLLRLNKKAHTQIAYILELIDEKTGANKLLYFLIAGFGLGGVGIAIGSLLLTLPHFFSFLEGLFSAILPNIPIFGLIFTIGRSFFSFYFNLVAAKKKALLHPWRENIFLLNQAVFNITAYTLLIFNAGIIYPLISLLFVIAAFVDVAKEVFNLWGEHRNHKNLSFIYEPTCTAAQKQKLIRDTYIRQEYTHQLHRNSLVINLATSILIVAIMAVWNFIPAGVLITLGAVTSIAVVFALKTFLLAINESHMREQTQIALKSPETIESPPLNSSFTSVLSVLNILPLTNQPIEEENLKEPTVSNTNPENQLVQFNNDHPESETFSRHSFSFPRSVRTEEAFTPSPKEVRLV